jgi:hypothetical protein
MPQTEVVVSLDNRTLAKLALAVAYAQGLRDVAVIDRATDRVLRYLDSIDRLPQSADSL